jgi:hypothetical protein
MLAQLIAKALSGRSPECLINLLRVSNVPEVTIVHKLFRVLAIAGYLGNSRAVELG